MLIPAWAISNRETEMLRQEMNPPQSESAIVNEFIVNSGQNPNGTLSSVQVEDLRFTVKLLTPLNSNFNHVGDPIKAEVEQAVGPADKPILPKGTILEGYVEGQHKNGRGMRDASIILKFYWAEIANQRYDLFLATNTSDGVIYPNHAPHPLTGKQKLRMVLMLATKVAIPCAIGTSGISLAITAGAGALIGGVLADNHQYFKGAVRGAWEGAGLNRLDPLIIKGAEVHLPFGTPIGVRLLAPTELPIFANTTPSYSQYLKDVLSRKNPKRRIDVTQDQNAQMLAGLSTSASLETEPETVFVTEEEYIKLGGTIDEARPSETDPLSKIQAFIDDKNLAAALETSKQALAQHPDDETLQAAQSSLIQLVTGCQGTTEKEKAADTNQSSSPRI